MYLHPQQRSEIRKKGQGNGYEFWWYTNNIVSETSGTISVANKAKVSWHCVYKKTYNRCIHLLLESNFNAAEKRERRTQFYLAGCLPINANLENLLTC